MAQSFARRLVALGASFAFALALPGLATATVEGPCQVTGTSSSGGTIDITTASEWHMNSTDTAGGSGTATGEQSNASVGAFALGVRLPIAQGSGNGGTSGSVDNVSVELYAILGKHFVVAGSSTGKDGPGCSGSIDIILDDVDPLFTFFGGGGLVLAIASLVALAILSRKSPSCFGRILGGIFGAVGGAGLGLSLEQFDILDPEAPIGLVVVAVAVLIGLWTPGMLASGNPTSPSSGSGGSEPPAVPPVAPPPPVDEGAKSFVDDVVGPAAAPPSGSSSPGSQADDYGPDNQPVGGGSPG